MTDSPESLTSIASLEPEENEEENSLIQEEDIEEFFDAFSCFKVRQDGVDFMDMHDFPHFMRSMGQCSTEAEMLQMLREVGALETQRVTFNQILKIMRKHFESPHTEQELTKAFQVFDRSGDGTLGTNEIMFVINSLGEAYQEEEVREMFVEIDRDRDGRIRLDDFIALLGVPEMRTKPGTNKSCYKLR